MSGTGSLPVIDASRCGRCGLCTQVCPHHAVLLGDTGPVFSCPESCVESDVPGEPDVYCLPEEACPNDAMSWPFEIMLGDLRDK